MKNKTLIAAPRIIVGVYAQHAHKAGQRCWDEREFACTLVVDYSGTEKQVRKYAEMNAAHAKKSKSKYGLWYAKVAKVLFDALERTT